MWSLQDLKEGKVLLVDKPLEWTSFDVVNKIRATIRHTFAIKKIKVGHAGTLDPLATGLLIVCVGKATKQIVDFQGLDKRYEGVLKLGATTPTYDAEAEEDAQYALAHINNDMIVEASKSFIGETDQVPPIYSAIKKNGVRLYKLARKNQDIAIEPRRVQIHALAIEHIDMPHVSFSVVCSRGTYIRSLAYDLGRKLHSGAYLNALRRTHIGRFDVVDAWQVEELVQQIKQLK
ncbi:MAG: tRNA pseudouridine(55) synthase TruB [Saprospiraceae bacterium]|nr:tRNA pseudouridine(55) synthase TruB [Saprospiraceae bacterium]